LQIVEPARILINATDLDRRHRHRAFDQSKIMCGRFTIKTSRAKIAELIGNSKSLPLFEPRYNIAPSQPVLAIRIEPERGEREGTMLKWGLIPSWAKEPGIGNKLANARADTFAEKPAFRSCFKKYRCLVFSDVLYEFI
jgi:putative SOS response-associated peptidase YedK